MVAIAHCACVSLIPPFQVWTRVAVVFVTSNHASGTQGHTERIEWLSTRLRRLMACRSLKACARHPQYSRGFPAQQAWCAGAGYLRQVRMPTQRTMPPCKPSITVCKAGSHAVLGGYGAYGGKNILMLGTAVTWLVVNHYTPLQAAPASLVSTWRASWLRRAIPSRCSPVARSPSPLKSPTTPPTAMLATLHPSSTLPLTAKTLMPWFGHFQDSALMVGNTSL